MENFIYNLYNGPMCLLVLLALILILSWILYVSINEYIEKEQSKEEKEELINKTDLLKNQIRLLKRDLSYCKQFISNKDFERYKLHRQFDIELENYLKEQKYNKMEKWHK